MAWQPAYITTTELKDFLKIGDTDDDTEIDFAIEAASRAIDRDANRQFGQTSAEERFYTGEYDRRRSRWIIEIDDVMTTSGFDPQVQDVDGTDIGAIDDYNLEPRNASQAGRPWTKIMVGTSSTNVPTGRESEISVTATWGWSAVPDTIKQATLLQSSRFFARRTSPYGVAGSPDLGSELRLLARLDPDVAVMVGPYRRWWAAT